MTIEEFNKKVLALTDVEEKLKEGNYSYAEFLRQVLWGAVKEKNGYYFFSNKKMSVHPQNYELRFPISYSDGEHRLRLLIHTRFTKVPPHYNEFIGIHYIYSGKMSIDFPDLGIKKVLTKNHLIMINKNVVSSFEMDREDDIVLGIQIQDDYLRKELLYGLSDSSPVAEFLLKSLFGDSSEFTFMEFDLSHYSRINNLLVDLFSEYFEPNLCGDEIVQDYMHIFFILLIRASSKQLTEQTSRGILNILKYIEENCATCSLQKLSEKFNYNPKYISNLIKEKTGKTFVQLLMQAKLKSACYLLENTNRSIQEIVEMCGYKNQTYFYKKFHEHYDMSPKEYRDRFSMEEKEVELQ